MKKYHDNPYQSEYWKAQKEMEENEVEVSMIIVKAMALLLAIGVVYLILK
jgi:hypothetical protein